MASVYFNNYMHIYNVNNPYDLEKEDPEVKTDTTRIHVFSIPVFDSRVFVLPKEEVANYFIWRQQDWERNSVQLLGQANFSHKELQHKSNSDIQEMLFSKKGINWNNLDIHLKRGVSVYKEKKNEWIADWRIPVFTQDREYVEKWTKEEEEKN